MTNHNAGFPPLIAGSVLVGAAIAFFWFSDETTLPLAVPPASVAVEAEPPLETNPAFEQSADRVTIGAGQVAPQAITELAEFDRLLRRMAELPEGEEKMELARQVEAITDRAAVPVLIDWASVTPDRAVLRACLTALGRMGDAALIADLEQRHATTKIYNERYRLAKVIKNVTNPEAAPALIALAENPDVHSELVIAATDALASVATPPAVSLLLQRLESDQGEDGARLSTVISGIDRAEGLATLQYAALGNKEASAVRTRVAAIQALANFSDEQTREVLTQLGTDSTAEIRTAANAALNQMR